MDFLKQYVKSLVGQTWYEKALFLTTICLFGLYAYTYMASKNTYGEKYIPLLITIRTLVLSCFLIYFYNPLRTTYEYGHALPLFAFSAGVTMLFLVDKYDILNLVHFVLYGDVIPQNPKKVCKLVQDVENNVTHSE